MVLVGDMTTSIADIFEDYVESLQNLPSEIDQNMHELRSMDEEFQRFREIYTKHRRSYAKLLRNPSSPPTPNVAQPPPTPTAHVNLVAARLQLEKDYKTAIQKQDQKIELAMRMYDLVSRHIERIDSQMAKNGIAELDWIASNNHRRGPWDESWRHDAAASRKRSISNGGPAGFRKRTHHSSRPNPAINGHRALTELEIDPNEPRYCYCNQVSFGDMVACDGENCEKEWFHYACVGLVEPPAGKWFCDECAAEEDNYRFKQYTDDY
ncbi:uncharacterized protein BYT42DRAFT_66025 [Radiomyces spectabilis]|uniref:uncharacterized protein n=1 Tax=Radiomyces spectabilis TaxID=64574 RepID=UPI002220AC8A|nr:uncharacterized protein BYT42DRAFT_66025 [Radiomyces spectabilis]KAI8371387.1 hypothetical protein BYT42DRAFT_66025 [Radiomyces spectabilis]